MKISTKPNIHLHDGQPVVSTVDVATAFGRPHNQIMKGIRRGALDTSIDFIPATWRDRKHRTQPAYHLTRAGFALLTQKWRTGDDQALREKWLTTWKELLDFYAPSPAAKATDETPDSSTELQTVEFHGQNLYLIEKDGEPYVPMKTVVENMGLSWSRQRKKLTDNSARWSCVVLKATQPSDVQKRELLCIPLRRVFGWMMTIQPSRIRKEIRDKVIQYQTECDEVLSNYWTHGRADNPRATDLTLTENEVRYLYFLKATHGLSGASTRQPFKNQLSPNAAAIMWYLDKRQPDTSDGWHQCSIREISTALNLNSGNVATVIRTLNQWGFIESRYPGKSLRALHRLQLKVIDQVIERNQLDGALGALLTKFPEPSTSLH